MSPNKKIDRLEDKQDERAKFGFDTGHHQPRDFKNKKKKRTGGGVEEGQDRRAQRINFKRYLQELEEEALDDIDELDDSQLPDDDDQNGA